MRVDIHGRVRLPGEDETMRVDHTCRGMGMERSGEHVRE